MFEEMITRMVKPLVDEAYKKGFDAGVAAQILKEKKELTDRELTMYEYGYNMGVADYKAEHGVVEISAKEFESLVDEKPSEPAEPFGFVGTMDDMSLVLEEAEA
jgi:hypothetical protein